MLPRSTHQVESIFFDTRLIFGFDTENLPRWPFGGSSAAAINHVVEDGSSAIFRNFWTVLQRNLATKKIILKKLVEQ
jgi:hypothetical protein